MRPLALRLQAFGPFCEKQEISFAPVAETGGLFLIYGNTGSGKTSILDGICFALYGASSGDERSAMGLRCDLATEALATEAELEFSLGAERYLAVRRPARRVIKKRGKGFTEKKPEAELRRFDSATSEWVLVSSGDKDVSQKLRELLGMGADQFRQVVILPQGKFRIFLTANSAEREEILETLFRTSEFRELTETLKERFLELGNAMNESRFALEGRRAALGVSGAEQLKSRQSELESALEDARLKRASEEDRAAKARELANRSRAAARALLELQRASDRSAEVERAEQAAAEMKGLKQAHDRARPLEPAIATEARQTREAAELRGRLNEEAKEHEQALARRELAKQAALAADSEALVTAELLREASRIDDRLQAIDRFAKALENSQQTTENVLSAKKTLAAIETATQEKETRTADLDLRLQRLAIEAARVSGLESSRDFLRLRARAARSLIAALGELKQAQSASKNAQHDLAAAQSEAGKSELELARVRARHYSAQASFLARKLEPSSPCPVCGSKSHPAPAAPDVAGAGAEAVEAAENLFKNASENANLRLQAALRAQSHEQAQAESVERLAQDLESNLGSNSPSASSLQSDREALIALQTATDAEGVAAAKELKTASEAAATRAQLEKVYLAEKTETERLRLEAARARENCERLAALDAAARAETEAEARASSLSAAEIASADRRQTAIEALQKRRATALFRRSELEKAVQAARIELEEASAALARKQSLMSELERRSAHAVEAAEAARVSLAQSAKDAGFFDVEAARSALLPPGRSAEIERALLRQAEEKASATDALERARKESERLKARDYDQTQIEEALAAAELAFSEALSEYARLEETSRNFKMQSAEIEAAAAKIASSEMRYAALGRLARAAQGLGPENPTGVNLQRYVLAARLDLVLERASRRLGQMTRGQFSLRRVSSRDDGRKSAGLDIEVEDAETGTARPAAYLSGGESFMAALALALGLADIVQEASGGSRFDSVFIDEGFGTLDPEALALALRTLSDLQGQRSRMIGIISHVEELRLQIERRLCVRKTPKGSFAVWNPS